MYIDNKILAVAVGSLLLGGGAVAAYHGLQSVPAQRSAHAAMVTAQPANAAIASMPAEVDVAPLNLSAAPSSQAAVEYAPIVSVKPVTRSSVQYATVLDIDPVSRSVAQQVPRQQCHDVAVQKRLPERDGNVGGTVAGAIIGGLAGNQLGKHKGSDRRNIETVAGAVGGGFLGRYIDQRHVGGQVVNTTERQCRSVTDSVTSSQVIGYDVTFRNPDGSIGMKRMASKPGSRIALGHATTTTGYEVTYRHNGEQQVVRMAQRPGVDRFKVVDGRVVTQG